MAATHRKGTGQEEKNASKEHVFLMSYCLLRFLSQRQYVYFCTANQVN
jgi:hypothetical protein